MGTPATDKVIDLAAEVEARRLAEAELLTPPPEKTTSAGGPDDPRFVLQCLEENERGDGKLYAALHRGKFVYVKSRDEKAKAWFYWSGHHWEIDKADFHVAAVEDVALLYQREADKLTDPIKAARDLSGQVASLTKQLKQMQCDEASDEDRSKVVAMLKEAESASLELKKLTRHKKDLTDRIKKLRSCGGVKSCIDFAHKLGRDGLFIYGDEVDQRPLLLACQNGVIDLETGELIPGRPDDYLVRFIPVEYQGINIPCPVYDKFLAEIHRHDPDLIEFIDRFLGSCLSGRDPYQVYACFIGEGANGKGTLFEILRELFGDLSWSINPELLLDNKNTKSPDGPSPAVMSLQGRRLVVASETDEGRKISASAIKKFTGGDTLTGRNLFDKYDTNFGPTHKLVLYTNHAPRGLAADFALFRRLLYIEYPLRYVEDVEYHKANDPQNAAIYHPLDSKLKDKLRQEFPGILARLVRGFLRTQHPSDGGLKIPASIRAAVEDVRRKEDYIEQFLNNVCRQNEHGQSFSLQSGEGALFKATYERFAKWYKDEIGGEEKFLMSKRKFGEQLRRKGYIFPDPSTTSGKQGIVGITWAGIAYDDEFIWRDCPAGGAGNYE